MYTPPSIFWTHVAVERLRRSNLYWGCITLASAGVLAVGLNIMLAEMAATLLRPDSLPVARAPLFVIFVGTGVWLAAYIHRKLAMSRIILGYFEAQVSKFMRQWELFELTSDRIFCLGRPERSRATVSPRESLASLVESKLISEFEAERLLKCLRLRNRLFYGEYLVTPSVDSSIAFLESIIPRLEIAIKSDSGLPADPAKSSST